MEPPAGALTTIGPFSGAGEKSSPHGRFDLRAVPQADLRHGQQGDHSGRGLPWPMPGAEDREAAIKPTRPRPDYTTLLTDLILERSMCEVCLASKAGLSGSSLRTVLIRIRTIFQLHDGVGRCRECGESKHVLSLDRSAA